MAFRFHERPNSGRFTAHPATYTSQWVAHGSSDREYVQAYAIAGTPAIVTTAAGILYRQDLSIEPAGASVFHISVPYAQFKKETGSYRLSFDTSGGMIHISNSLESIRRYHLEELPSPDPPFAVMTTMEEAGDAPEAKPGAPYHGGAIGVHGKEVDGFDKFIPALKITATFRHPAAIITLPTIKNLARYTGCVNSTTFLTFAPGETLLLGASGDEGTDTETSVAYTFAMSENEDDLTIGDFTGIVKEGHDVLWIKYHDYVGASEMPSRRPKNIYTERVYKRIDMAAALGFGG